MFLLGSPASTRSMISRCRGVSPATWLAAAACQAESTQWSRDRSSARSMLASNSRHGTGFSMKSDAPAFIASTAIGTSLLPAIMIDGSASPPPPSRRSSSSPGMPGRQASTTRQAAPPGR